MPARLEPGAELGRFGDFARSFWPGAAVLMLCCGPSSAAEDPFDSAAARSIVVRNGEERVAQAPPAGAAYDPFDDAEVQPAAPAGIELGAAMPDAEPQAPSPSESGYDPFEDFSAAPPAPAVEAEVAAPVFDEASEAPVAEEHAADDLAAAPAVEQLFEEPQPAAPAGVDSDLEELKAAKEAIDREMMRREVESGANNEITPPNAENEADSENAGARDGGLADEISGADESGEEAAIRELEEQLKAQIELTPEQEAERRRQLELARQQNEEKCQRLYEEVRADSIKSISLDIRVEGNPGEDFPFECTGTNPPFVPRAWSQVTYQWKASALCHKPLYFEQVGLERYGHDWGPALQPIMSGAHFFGTIPILPYKMGLQTPNECVYTLGHYRPGSCAPYMISPPGFTWRAAAFQAGAVTGVAAAVP